VTREWDPWNRVVTDVDAAAARIRLWLEQHPQNISVASEIGGSDGYQSGEWPFRLYGVDRRDLEAVLTAVEEKRKGEGA
jgi:hypothetical protein